MLGLIMLSRIVFLSVLSVAFSDIFDSAIERKINATLQTTNTSDTALLLDIDTFVSYNGLRNGDSFLDSSISESPPANLTKGDLRVQPKYISPKLHLVKNKMLDLMKQAIYTTQERMENLIPILRRYENDASFRMAFIFNRFVSRSRNPVIFRNNKLNEQLRNDWPVSRLRQILIDMRRVYTLAWRSRKKTEPKVMRVYEQIFWYAHIVKKYFDILYIVEYVIEFHNDNLKVLLS